MFFREIITKVKLAIQVQEGRTKKGKPGRRTFKIPKIRAEATQEQIKTAMAALDVILEFPIIGVRLIVERKTPVWWPELRQMLEAKQKAFASTETGASNTSTQSRTGYISAHSGVSSGPSSGRLQTIPRILAEERHHAPYMIRLEDMFKHPTANTIAYVGYEPTPEYYLMPQVYGDGAQGF